MKKVEAITRSTSMPIIAAASRSNAVARIALPSRERATSSVSADHHREGGADHDEPDHPDVERAAVERHLRIDEVERVVRSELRAVEQEHRVLDEERRAERRDQRRDSRRGAQRPVGEALEHDADAAARHHRPERHQHDQQPDGDARILRPAEPAEDAPADEGADHHHVAVGEVEQLEDPVDHREAERDEGVHASQRQAVDGQLDELVPVHGRIRRGGPERGGREAGLQGLAASGGGPSQSRPRRASIPRRLCDVRVLPVRDAEEVPVDSRRHRPSA